MDVQFIEASNGANYGKFMVGRFTELESATKTHMPEANGESLWYYAGLRRMNPYRTLVMDLQTGEGAEFSLSGGREEAAWALRDRHPKLWVCPLFPPFLGWLFECCSKMTVEEMPRFVDLTGRDVL